MAAIEDFLKDCERRMDASIEHTRTEFNSVRTGRASTALLDRITIDSMSVDRRRFAITSRRSTKG